MFFSVKIQSGSKTRCNKKLQKNYISECILTGQVCLCYHINNLLYLVHYSIKCEIKRKYNYILPKNLYPQVA